MNLSAIVAYNQAGRVGSSSIYTATVADRMVATSQATTSQYLHKRRVQPAVVLNISNNQNTCNTL